MLKWSGLPWQGPLVAAGGLRNSPNHSVRSQEPTCLENQLLQKYHCHFTPAKTFSFSQIWETSPCLCMWNTWVKCGSIRSTNHRSRGALAVGQEQAHSPTILTLFFHFLVLPTELLFLIHSHSLFKIFFLFFLLSYWQRLPLCGKSLYARRFCKIPLPEAHEVCARELVHSGDVFR